MIRHFVTGWFLRSTYRGEDEDGGGAAGNALVVVVLYLGDVVAEVAAVVHTAVAAKYNANRQSLFQWIVSIEPPPRICHAKSAKYSKVCNGLVGARTITF